MKKNTFAFHLLQALAPLLAVIVAGISYRAFLAFAIAGNPVLDTLILAVGGFGAILMLSRLFDVDRERRTLRRYAKEVEDGADMKELLDAPWLKGRATKRFLDHIAQTGGKLHSQLDQNAIESEHEALRGDFDSKMEMPSFLVGFMIALGLLGTFIGLLETLTGISGMLDGMATNQAPGSLDSEFMKLVGELRKPLAGMGIAFSASMFGLVGSLVLGLMQVSVRRYIKLVLGDARSVVHALTERVRTPQSFSVPGAVHGGVSEAFLSDFMAELVGNMNQLQELFQRSQNASISVSNRVDMLSQRLEEVAGAIDRNVEAAKRTNDLLGFGPRMKETNEEMLGEIRSLLAAGQGQQTILGRLADVLNSIEQRMTVNNETSHTHLDLAGTYSRDSLAKLDETVTLLHSVNDRTTDSEVKLDRKLQGLTTATTNIVSALQQMASRLGEVAGFGQSQISASTSAQQLLRDRSVEIQSQLRDLTERLQKLQDVELGGTRHLYDIKESFNGLTSALEPLKGLSQGVSRQSTLLESTLEELQASQRNLARDLRTELREVAREIARASLLTTPPPVAAPSLAE